MTTPLEELLRSHRMWRGAIQMACVDGQWGVTVTHHGGHQVHPMGKWHDDPVDALRAALIEDERMQREQVRKYSGAPKLGQQIDIEDVLDDDDFGDLCG